MSVQNEILRIQTAKNNLKTSIRNKDVTVPDATKIDGYPPLVDSISGGGGSSYTLLDTKEYAVSTTSTSSTVVDTISLTGTDYYKKILYVKIRDKAGKRNDYFYGSDTFIVNPVGGSALNNYKNQFIYKTDSNGNLECTSTSTYGMYIVDQNFVTNPVTFNIRARYNSSYSGTIDGTYSVEIYYLEWPNNASPFE